MGVSLPVKTKCIFKAASEIPLVSLVKASFMLGEEVVFPKVTWQWKPGEQWAILGPNGGGKSLFVQAIQGGLRRFSGEVTHGFDLEAGEARHDGALVPGAGIVEVSPRIQRELARQVSDYYQARWHGSEEGEGLTVGGYLSQSSVENILPFEVNAHYSDPILFARARRRYVKWLEFAPMLRRKMAWLSNGEQRKALLIHALLKFPRLLILDDPYGGLDAMTRMSVSAAIEQLMLTGARVMVAVSRPEELPAGATHVLLIHRKKVAAQGAKEEILNLELTRRLYQQGKAINRSKVKVRTEREAPAPGSVPHSPPSAPLIEMRNIRIQNRGKAILDGIDWVVKTGDRWALTGHNGAGKTTLLSLIQGDHPQVYAQNIQFFGSPVNSTQSLWKTRMRIGWMSPELNLHHPTDWSCLDVVCSGFFNSIGLYHGCSAAQRTTGRRWLRIMGLDEFARTAFGSLSTGMQRLVLLCRAVVKKPQLLILDEPCQGVDARHSTLILRAVDRVIEKTGAALIFVTHHQGELPECITHSMTLKNGKVR